MAKIVVETAETKKRVTEALSENDFQRAVAYYKENSASGRPFGTILSGDANGTEHRLLLQINPTDNDEASGSFVVGFKELADAVYDALSFGGRTSALSDYPAFGAVENEEDAATGFSESSAEFSACDPVAIMERKRAEAEALADALGDAVDKLRVDLPRYDAWLARMKRAE